MTARRFATRLTRGSSHLSLWLTLMGCAGDSRLDPDSEDITGNWDIRVENITGPTAAEPIVCTATWTMSIESATDAAAPEPYVSQVPLDAFFECTNGYSTLLPHRGLPLVLTRAGSRLTFIAEISRDTFAVATLVDSELMRGSTGPKFYGGGELSAKR